MRERRNRDNYEEETDRKKKYNYHSVLNYFTTRTRVCNRHVTVKVKNKKKEHVLNNQGECYYQENQSGDYQGFKSLEVDY